MQDLKTFLKNRKNNTVQSKEETIKTNTSEFSGNYGESDSFETVQNVYDSLKDKSKGELMSTLMAEVAKRKQDGTFSNRDIEDFATRVAPMLDPTSRAELDRLVSLIKSQ